MRVPLLRRSSRQTPYEGESSPPLEAAGGPRQRPAHLRRLVAARRRWLLRLVFSAALALGLTYVPYRLFDGDGGNSNRVLNLRGERERLLDSLSELQSQNRQLRREIQALKSDVGAIEDIARDELGMVRADEIILRLAERPRAVEAGATP